MRVAIADDFSLFREGLALLLEQIDVEVVLQAASGEELLRKLTPGAADVVILDLRMPPTFTEEGLRCAELLRFRYPRLGVLLLSAYIETAVAARLLELGHAGYLLTDRVDTVEQLADALDRLSAGEQVLDPAVVDRLMRRGDGPLGELSERERQVLRELALGRSNLGIANELSLSVKTVEGHLKVVFGKLGVPADVEDNRRVLAALTWLRSAEHPVHRD